MLRLKCRPGRQRGVHGQVIYGLGGMGDASLCLRCGYETYGNIKFRESIRPVQAPEDWPAIEAARRLPFGMNWDKSSVVYGSQGQERLEPPAKPVSYQERLIEFVRESNRIERIHREPTDAELEAHEVLLKSDHLTLRGIEQFVATVQPGAILREKTGYNVMMGKWIPPAGGPAIVYRLSEIIASPASAQRAYQRHAAYENLHPFTDGNGRSGRAIWLWDMGGLLNVPLGFLQHWYYQSLENHHSGDT